MLYVISFFFLPSPKGTFSRRETNSPSGTKKTKREEKVPFGEGKKQGNQKQRGNCPLLFIPKGELISCSFTPRRGLFLLFSSSGRKKPKEETKLLFFSLLFSKGERNHRGITFGRKKLKRRQIFPFVPLLFVSLLFFIPTFCQRQTKPKENEKVGKKKENETKGERKSSKTSKTLTGTKFR